MAEKLRYGLTSTDTHHEIADQISTTPPDWERIGQHLTGLTRSINDKDESNLLGTLSEAHILTVLDEMAASHPTVDTTPIPHGTTQGRFIFLHQDTGGYRVANQHQYRRGKVHSDVTQFDALMLVDDVPTILELKMGQSNGSIKKAFDIDRLNDAFYPLQLYFGTDELAYLVVLSRNMVNPKSENQHRIIAEGGLIVPFYTSGGEFLNEIRDNSSAWHVDWSAYAV